MYTCKYCGSKTPIDPSDQIQPADYCGDHFEEYTPWEALDDTEPEGVTTRDDKTGA